MPSVFRRLKKVSQPGVLVAGLLVATSSSANALGFNDINPIYNSIDDETQLNVNINNLPTSFGYFFNVEQGSQVLNALGYSSVISGVESYVVTLWRYVNGGLDLPDYNVLATATFDAACSGCIAKDFYNWLEVAPVTLAQSSNDPSTGYVITAEGNFQQGQQSVLSGGTGTFASTASFDGGGYNFTGGFGFPIPFGVATDIQGADAYSFFNANASFTASVPGPLPIFGAAAAFGWTRKLKRRIKISG